MGKRDYQHREVKKPKKDTKKIIPSITLPTPANVEVLQKAKKKREDEEEAER